MNLHYLEADVEEAIVQSIGAFLATASLTISERDVVIVARQLKIPRYGICDIIAADRQPINGCGYLYLIEVKRDQVDERAVCQLIRYTSAMKELVEILRIRDDATTAVDFLRSLHGINSIPAAMPEWVGDPSIRIVYNSILAGSSITDQAANTLDALSDSAYNKDGLDWFHFCRVRPSVSWEFAGPSRLFQEKHGALPREQQASWTRS